MIRKTQLAFVLPLLVGLGACATGEKMRNVQIGMTRDQVVSVMGPPDGDMRAGDSEAMTYSNRLMSGFSWDRADYHVVLRDGRVTGYGAGTIRQNQVAGADILFLVPVR